MLHRVILILTMVLALGTSLAATATTADAQTLCGRWRCVTTAGWSPWYRTSAWYGGWYSPTYYQPVVVPVAPTWYPTWWGW